MTVDVILGADVPFLEPCSPSHQSSSVLGDLSVVGEGVRGGLSDRNPFLIYIETNLCKSVHHACGIHATELGGPVKVTQFIIECVPVSGFIKEIEMVKPVSRIYVLHIL